jgi:hypothetical protein
LSRRLVDLGIDSFSDTPVVGKHPNLYEHGYGQKNQNRYIYRRLLRANHLLKGASEKPGSDTEDHKSNGKGGDIFGPPVTLGMIFIGRLATHLDAEDLNEGGAKIA